MKIVAISTAVLTWIFVGLCAYFMFYADAGPDGLGNFFFIIITGGLSIVFLIAFLIQLWFVKEFSKGFKAIFAILVILPILLMLLKVFYVPQSTLPEVETLENIE